MPGGLGASRADLASVMRGLSAIFWGLPLTLLAYARHFLSTWPSPYDLLLPVIGSGSLLVGVSLMRRLHRGERVWQRSLLLTQILAMMMVGLSPFLFLWSRLPQVEMYARAVLILLGVAFAFALALTGMLVRLAALLPDETARGDARMFHALSLYVVAVLFGAGAAVYFRLSPIPLSDFLALPRQPYGFGRQALLLLLTLVPVAMSMAVAWKLKEVALAVVVSDRS